MTTTRQKHQKEHKNKLLNRWIAGHDLIARQLPNRNAHETWDFKEQDPVRITSGVHKELELLNGFKTRPWGITAVCVGCCTNHDLGYKAIHVFGPFIIEGQQYRLVSLMFIPVKSSIKNLYDDWDRYVLCKDKYHLHLPIHDELGLGPLELKRIVLILEMHAEHLNWENECLWGDEDQFLASSQALYEIAQTKYRDSVKRAMRASGQYIQNSLDITIDTFFTNRVTSLTYDKLISSQDNRGFETHYEIIGEALREEASINKNTRQKPDLVFKQKATILEVVRRKLGIKATQKPDCKDCLWKAAPNVCDCKEVRSNLQSHLLSLHTFALNHRTPIFLFCPRDDRLCEVKIYPAAERDRNFSFECDFHPTNCKIIIQVDPTHFLQLQVVDQKHKDNKWMKLYLESGVIQGPHWNSSTAQIPKLQEVLYGSTAQTAIAQGTFTTSVANQEIKADSSSTAQIPKLQEVLHGSTAQTAIAPGTFTTSVAKVQIKATSEVPLIDPTSQLLFQDSKSEEPLLDQRSRLQSNLESTIEVCAVTKEIAEPQILNAVDDIQKSSAQNNAVINQNFESGVLMVEHNATNRKPQTQSGQQTPLTNSVSDQPERPTFVQQGQVCNNKNLNAPQIEPPNGQRDQEDMAAHLRQMFADLKTISTDAQMKELEGEMLKILQNKQPSSNTDKRGGLRLRRENKQKKKEKKVYERKLPEAMGLKFADRTLYIQEANLIINYILQYKKTCFICVLNDKKDGCGSDDDYKRHALALRDPGVGEALHKLFTGDSQEVKAMKRFRGRINRSVLYQLLKDDEESTKQCVQMYTKNQNGEDGGALAQVFLYLANDKHSADTVAWFRNRFIPALDQNIATRQEYWDAVGTINSEKVQRRIRRMLEVPAQFMAIRKEFKFQLMPDLFAWEHDEQGQQTRLDTARLLSKIRKHIKENKELIDSKIKTKE